MSVLNKPWLHGDVRNQMPVLARYSMFIGAVGVVLNLVLIVTNAYYEAVIPLAERSDHLSDAAFTFIDYLVFLTPYLMLVAFIVYGIWGFKYCERKYQQIVVQSDAKYLKAADEEIAQLEDELAFVKKSFYVNCPKCGAAREEKDRQCRYCGADLEIHGK